MLVSIIIPVYEMGSVGTKFVNISLEKINLQTYKNIEVIISDHSKDSAIENICNSFKNKLNIRYVKNKNDVGNSSANLNNALKLCKGEIIKILMQELKDYPDNIRITNKVLFSYGSALWSNSAKCFSRPYSKEEFENIKKYPYKVSHLRCFSGIVWKSMITQFSDLGFSKDKDGKFYRSGYDTILCIPMLQICGYEHTFHNSTPIYYYRLHDKNDHVIDQNLQWSVHAEALKKPPFKKIDSFL